MRDTILPPQMQEESDKAPQQPQGNPPAGQTGRLILTETALQHTLMTALPEAFPVSALEADIEAEGTVKLKLEIGRDRLTNYLKRAGVDLSLKEKLFLRLLPKTIEASCLLRLTGGEAGGLAMLVPEKLALNEHSIKVDALPQELLDEFGAVSEPVARAMAEGARTLTGADFAVSVTGVAGPDSDDRGNPVGTVFVGLAAAEGVFCRALKLGRRRRDRIRDLAANHAFDMLRRYLTGLDPEKL
jgi:PncC family amidohydrolase